MLRTRLATVLLVFALRTGIAAAQTATPAAPPASSTTWTLRDWTRVEGWHFFEPPLGGGDYAYAYGANRLQAGVRRNTPRYAVAAAFQYVQFGNLPAHAVGPGPLGLGAVYFAHAGRSDSRQLYVKYLNVLVKDVLPGLHVQVGRMPYTSGGESPSGDSKMEAVKRQRVDARLIGEFDWSIYQRAFDGVRADVSRRAWSATGVALYPTQGGFEDAAGVMMTDVTLLGGSLSMKPGAVIRHTDWQLFAFRYRDTREVTARPDNSGKPAVTVDVRVNTIGTTLASASPPVSGRQWDGLLWMAAQTGSWYGQPHRAYSVAAEIGHQWSAAPAQPWIRGGVVRASGDRDPADDRHATFFQMLPTVRRYAQSTTFSQMNAVDVFGQLLLRPAPSLTFRADVHHVSLATARDAWYFGSGATQTRGALFGFSTRPSNGHTGLGTSLELSADKTLSKTWSINGYLGVTRGGDVVRSVFAGPTMTFAYLENVLQF